MKDLSTRSPQANTNVCTLGLNFFGYVDKRHHLVGFGSYSSLAVELADMERLPVISGTEPCSAIDLKILNENGDVLKGFSASDFNVEAVPKGSFDCSLEIHEDSGSPFLNLTKLFDKTARKPSSLQVSLSHKGPLKIIVAVD
eukprot:TRINITY_DN3217_c0_g1_i1.p1 TRINITY_DN3217_c0_g1~~TRINITY_DN3217_c0_g1_i1.p1  ORF type:complete len:142 (-),score=31.87 TRINITY_DN3217_c0_g1_i1:120-545(-)